MCRGGGRYSYKKIMSTGVYKNCQPQQWPDMGFTFEKRGQQGRRRNETDAGAASDDRHIGGARTPRGTRRIRGVGHAAMWRKEAARRGTVSRNRLSNEGGRRGDVREKKHPRHVDEHGGGGALREAKPGDGGRKRAVPAGIKEFEVKKKGRGEGGPVPGGKVLAGGMVSDLRRGEGSGYRPGQS